MEKDDITGGTTIGGIHRPSGNLLFFMLGQRIGGCLTVRDIQTYVTVHAKRWHKSAK